MTTEALAAALFACAAVAAETGGAPGPIELVAASFLGGSFDDEIVGAGIGGDGSVVLAGNSVDLPLRGARLTLFGPPGELRAAEPPSDPKKAKGWVHPGTFGFVARLSPDGKEARSLARFGHGVATLKKMLIDGKGGICVLGEAREHVTIGTASGKGTFVAALSNDASRVLAAVFHAGALDFGVGSGGELVVLTKGRLTGYGPDWRTQAWTASWSAHGDDRPGGVAVSPRSGVAAVVGYGMTHTGKEPWKDPYAFGFDRSGRRIWSLWNPEPGRQKAAQFGGNGLMADTTGRRAVAGPGGEILLLLYADGGNSVCTRDPADPDRPLDPSVFEGAYQKGPGHGFKGASTTSVVFRIDPLTGKLEKGTWMCAWPEPARANSLSMVDAATDERGGVFLVGNSAYGCPAKNSWFEYPEGTYRGGGFLAVFDRNFAMIQCGYFAGCSLASVACRDGRVVVAGSAKEPPAGPAVDQADRAGGPKKFSAIPPLASPVQARFGGGPRDGYFAVFQAR